mgnify:CR=1 FL=1
MTTKSRTYPDISYVETDTETIVNTLIQGYEKIAGRTLYPADPARLFILWVADIIVQERVNIDFSAKPAVCRGRISGFSRRTVQGRGAVGA